MGRAEGNVKGKVAGLISYARRNSSIGTKAFFRSAQTCFGPGAPRGQKSFRDKLSRGGITLKATPRIFDIGGDKA